MHFSEHQAFIGAQFAILRNLYDRLIVQEWFSDSETARALLAQTILTTPMHTLFETEVFFRCMRETAERNMKLERVPPVEVSNFVEDPGRRNAL